MKWQLQNTQYLMTIAIICLTFRESFAETPNCHLPGLEGSPCVYVMSCAELRNLLNSSVRKPSLEVLAYLATLQCSGPGISYCCPSTNQTTTVKPTAATTVKPHRTTTLKPPETTTIKAETTTEDDSKYLEYPKPLIVNEISGHKNFGLINSEKCGLSSAQRIFGGKKTKPGEFPWMVLLQYNDREKHKRVFRCGGSLISELYVLTAAHCFNKDLVAVRLGEHTISTVEDWKAGATEPYTVQDIDIESFVAYSKYDKYRKLNDIGLIRLQSPANLKKPNIKTICLPVEEDNQFENLDEYDDEIRNNLVVAGWGRTENGSGSDVLMQATLTNFNIIACNSSLASIPVFECFICAKSKTSKKIDSCHGDSGGPLFATAEVANKVKTIQYGVVSAGVGCENEEDNYPGIYTNVGYYIDWILDQMDSE